MMRRARKPQSGCGRGRAEKIGRGKPSRVPVRSASSANAIAHVRIPVKAFGLAILAAIGCACLPLGQEAIAQDPALTTRRTTPAPHFGDTGDLMPATSIDRTQPLYLQGDQLIYDNAGNNVIARGNVEIYYNNYILTADEVAYDQSANTLTAVGNVVLKEPNGNVIRADRYTLTDDFRDGFVQQLSVVAKDDTRIAATRATRREGNITEFSEAKFTPCRTDGGAPPLWCLSAQTIIHDQQAATITYQDAQFELFGQPILYLPYFQHADPSVKRRSGFLVPTFGTSSDLGFMTTVPYYFALAPNYDFTFHPTYMTKQGVLWQGDFRHRLANGQYNIKFAAIDQNCGDLPDSTKANTEKCEDLDGWRGSLETHGLFSLSSWWKMGWDITLESDDSFRRFYQLDSILLTDRVNVVFLEGQSDRNYFGMNFYHFGGLTFYDTPQSESRVHPIIDHNYVFADPVLGGELRVDSNVLSFSRGDFYADSASSEDINRAITEVTWRRKLIDSIGITYTPFANLRGDLYQINNFVDPVTGELVSDESVVRGVASAGATIAYPWIASSFNATHTIEPIGQIITRNESVPQRHLPDEDAKSLVFDDTNLFEFDKFSGYDRVETGTRANVGVQYTFQSNTGGYARLLAGQSFQLAGNNPYSDPGYSDFSTGEHVFNPDSGLETRRSDYVMGLYLAPTDLFRVISQSRFDEDSLALRRQDAALVANFGLFTADAVYTYAHESPALVTEGLDYTNQQELSGSLGMRLTDNWSIRGRMRYDVDDNFVLSDAIQLRYADECFVLTATYSERFYNDPERDIDTDRTLFLRFELKHLGDFEYKTDALDYIMGDQQPPNAP